MLDKKTLLEIKNFAVKTDWNSAFGGKSKGNKHLFRVVKIAKFLAQKLNADVLVVEAGALLHDVVLPSGKEFDYELSKNLAKKLLKPFALTPDELNNIVECVASHEGTVRPKTLEAKIVHDADVLEKSGTLGIIRHTWKMVNLNKLNPKKINDRDVKQILGHIKWRGTRLQTPLAKRINKHLTTSMGKRKSRTIISITAELAADGMITERIAQAMDKYLNQIQRKKLKQQLTLGYLRLFK